MALLIALVVLVLAVTACVTLARAATTAKLRSSLNDRTRLCEDLLLAAEAPILNWLQKESAKVVLPEDATQPIVLVLNDRFEVDGTIRELAITAWDQLGMVPLNVARGGSPLRLALPVEVRSAIDAIEIPSNQQPGLDWVVSSDPKERGLVVFPLAEDEAPVRFGDEVDSVGGDSARGPSDVLPRGIGALVATHNRDPVRINVNTAPLPLVEAAMRVSGRGGVEAVREARAHGQAASADASSGRRDSVALVSSSDCWSFRIDVRVGNVQQSWWAVYRRSSDRARRSRESASGGGGWECVQRLVIPE